MRFLSRAALTAFALLACAFLPAQASARGLDAYDVTFENGQQLEQLARQGFDMTEARRGNKVEVVATTKQAKQLRALRPQRRSARRPAASRRASGALAAHGRLVGRLPPVLRRHLRRPRRPRHAHGHDAQDDLPGAHSTRGRPPGPRQAGQPRHDDQRQAARRVQDHQERARDPGRPASRDALLVDAARARVARRPRRSAGSCTCSSRTTAAPVRPWTSSGDTRSNGATKEEITQIVNNNELWFLPVANPDGYDYTFTPDNRLWRKNLRDNNNDGQITPEPGRRRPEPQLPDELELRQRGLVERLRERDLPRPRPRLRGGDEGLPEAARPGRLRDERQLPHGR